MFTPHRAARGRDAEHTDPRRDAHPAGGTTNRVTGADLSADGTQLAVRSYTSVLLWTRNATAPVWDAFASAPCVGPVPQEVKGEAVAFDADGRGYVTVNEGVNSMLHGFRLP